MKKIKLLFLPALLVLLSACEFCDEPAQKGPFTTNPVSARRIKVGSRPAIPLAAGGKALCEVVIPEKASPMLRYAGSQLAFYLEKIIGGKVDVTAKPSGTRAAFLLGPAGAELAGFDLTKLDRDGYFTIF